MTFHLNLFLLPFLVTAQVCLAFSPNNNEFFSRRQWISETMASTILSTTIVVAAPGLVQAEEEQQTSSSLPTYSIQKCSTSSKAPCVSTANVRQLDLYLPPWTFTQPADEVMSRLKGAVVADSSCEIVEQVGSQYLRVQAKRIGGSVDELEFVISESDKVVTFRSAASNSDSSDFGTNKKRLEEIRKRAGIFEKMGSNMNSADSVSYSEQGYGPLGQLKAFYGLQSGGGFEDVLKE